MIKFKDKHLVWAGVSRSFYGTSEINRGEVGVRI